MVEALLYSLPRATSHRLSIAVGSPFRNCHKRAALGQPLETAQVNSWLHNVTSQDVSITTDYQRKQELGYWWVGEGSSKDSAGPYDRGNTGTADREVGSLPLILFNS